MSGIAGLLRTDGAPVDPALIRRLTESLSFRGPDALQVWNHGQVAFGHTLLRTTDESKNESQPFTLDRDVWIVADARVDARHELIAKLDGPAGLHSAPDVELILRAYLRWGESCVEHFIGDFAFAIWDGRSRSLFCARDHMGVKPFYYAHVGPWFIFSNTLDCVRLHSAVSDKLNDLAIADFLLFGGNQDASTTSFSDIRRLQLAHTLNCSSSGLRLKRYWTLPIEEPVYYRDDREYIDRFRQLLREAVSDRLRTQRVSVLMSGGLDSPALAATAVDWLSAPDAVQAFTFVFDQLIPHSERYYAGLVADHLRIPIHYYALDTRTEWTFADRRTPEPIHPPGDWETDLDCWSAMAAHSRVALYGEGPDNALHYEWRPHLAWLARHRRWGRLLLDVGKHLHQHRRVPLLPTVPRMLLQWCKGNQWDPVFPSWLDSGLVERLRLRERWLAFNATTPSPHPVRHLGYCSLEIPLWQSIFETLEPPYTCATLEFRHPYIDIRLLRFMLSVPALPWCRKKHLMRCAMRGVLPELVRRRPKTPLQSHPDYERAGLHGLPTLHLSPLLAAYGEFGNLSQARPESMATFYICLRFAALSHWLATFGSIRRIDKEKTNYGRSEDTIIIRSA